MMRSTKQTKTNISDETSNIHENETETETENTINVESDNDD